MDGSEPGPNSPKYEKPFKLNKPVTLKAIGYDPETGKRSESRSVHLDVPKADWKVVRVSSGDIDGAEKLIDEDPNTAWATDKGVKTPQEIVIDLGGTYELRGFTYLPIQDRYPFGIITDYEFSVSTDNKNWRTASQGEFGNVVNNRILQTINFAPVRARFIKLRAVKVDGDDQTASFAEVGILTTGKE